MRAVVFLGPTMPVSDASRILGAEYRPPVQQGGVLELLRADPPDVIGIVDGYFDRVPAVWHKEILEAMSRGVHVVGAASMGALRAAELDAYGMVGIGRVYEWYRDGVLTDDDEVAVAHGPPDTGYRALSDAMVDLRDLVADAVATAVIGAELGDHLLASAKARHYPDRSLRAVVESARREGWEPAALDALSSWASARGPGLKRRDATALLRHVAELGAAGVPRTEPPTSVNRTVFLEQLENEVALLAVERGTGGDGSEEPADLDVDEVLRSGETAAVTRKKVLLRLLVRREAQRLGLQVGDDELQSAADAFRLEHGLERLDDTLAWFAQEGITEPGWVEFLRDRCLTEKLERLLHHDIERALAQHVAIASARRRAAPQAPAGSE